ncbi:MAG: pseudaminic acid cytidylyltransferase [Eubacteriales bacterium]|nr:pseudaminic acid cytidylyltransferase [Eubacteriales bacterium]
MSALAIITARGGSKRIPRKNIRPFLGRPILTYSVEAALSAGVFDEVMVSTEDEEIARIAREAGASVPFLRSAQSADDYASTDDVIREVLCRYREQGQSFDAFCCIYPTAPFVTAQKLCTAMEMLLRADSVMPVTTYPYPVLRSLKVDSEGHIGYKWPEFAAARSQDLEALYHDCGQFYACRTEAFFREGTTDVPGMVPLFLPELEVQDIDTEEDWAIAELKYQKMLEKKTHE